MAGVATPSTETLAEWLENGATWYRVTRVNGLIRLETARNGSVKADREWVMCVPEGRQAFDALLVGIAKIDRDRNRLLAAARRIYAALGHALACIPDRSEADAIRATLPTTLPMMGVDDE